MKVLTCYKNSYARYSFKVIEIFHGKRAMEIFLRLSVVESVHSIRPGKCICNIKQGFTQETRIEQTIS